MAGSFNPKVEFNTDPTITIADYYKGGLSQWFLPIREKYHRETCRDDFKTGPAIYATLSDRREAGGFGFFWRHNGLDHDILAKYTPATNTWETSPLRRTEVETALFAYFLLQGIPVLGTLHFKTEGEEIGHVIAWLMRSKWDDNNTLNVKISLFETYESYPGNNGWLEQVKAVPNTAIQTLLKHRTGGFLADGEASRLIPKDVADAWTAEKVPTAVNTRVFRYFPRNDQNLQIREADDMGRCVRWAYIFMDYLTSLQTLDEKPIRLSDATPVHFRFIVDQLAMLVTVPSMYEDLINTRGMNRRRGGRRRRTHRRRRTQKRLSTRKHKVNK
jgi:hypothetical protein